MALRIALLLSLLVRLALLAFLGTQTVGASRKVPPYLGARHRPTTLALRDLSLLSSDCLPPSGDALREAVFECMTSWGIYMAPAFAVLTPETPRTSSGLSCEFFSMTSINTGHSTGRLQPSVDLMGLQAFLRAHPNTTTHLAGTDPNTGDLAQTLAAAFASFCAPPPAPPTAPLPSTASALTSSATPQRTAPLQTNPPALQLPAHIAIWAASRSLQATGEAAGNPTSTDATTATATPSAIATTATTATTLAPPQPAAAPLPKPRKVHHAAAGAASYLRAEQLAKALWPIYVLRTDDTISFTAPSACVYEYEIQGTTAWLDPTAPGGLPVRHPALLTALVTVAGGVLMLSVALGWFVLGRFLAVRQTRIAEQLLAEQRERERAETEAMIAAARGNRGSRAGTRGGSAEGSGSVAGSSTASATSSRGALAGDGAQPASRAGELL